MPLIKPHLFFFTVFFIVLSANLVTAQPVVNLKDIRKINLIDASWGLGASRLTTFEIVPENGSWKCYQTKQKYEGIYFKKVEKASDLVNPLNTDKRIFVKNISDTLLVALLNTIKITKPVFKPEYIYISKDSVLNNINYAALKKLHMKFGTPQRDTFFKLLNNGQLIDRAKISLQRDYWTDDSPFCGIHIINKNNDTLKIETQRQVDYMLPWLINGTPSYDTSISRFFMASIGDYPFSAKLRLNGNWIYGKVYDYIKRTYTDEIFAREHIEKLSETNLNLLQKYFEIGKTVPYNDDFSLELSPRQFSGKIGITAIVDIKNSEQVNQLISFSEDTVKAFFDSGNFLVKACKNTNGCVIYLFNKYGISNKNHWFASQMDKTKLLANYDDTQLLDLSIYVPGKERNDEWLVLPDGKLLLYAYFYDDVFGIQPGLLLPSGDSVRKEVFVVFDSQGKLLFKN